MANPSRKWDRVPVFGVWQKAADEAPEPGTIHLRVARRIQRVDGRIIYPDGATISARIGDTDAHDTGIRTLVRAAWRAADEAADGEDFDALAWDEWWDTKVVPAAIFTSFPALDDPDIIGDPGNRVMVKEALTSAAGKEYPIQPLLAHLDLPIPGVNLGDQVVPTDAPSVPPPTFGKGQPGGVAPLGVDAKVPLEYLPDDIGGGGVLLTEYETQVASLPDYPAVFPPDTTALAQVATTGAYTDLTGRPTIPSTAADVGAVPTTRTVNGKPLSSNVTLDASDVSAVPTTRTVAGKPLSADVTLTAGDVGAVPTTRTVAGKALSSNVTLTPSDVGVGTSSTSTAGLVELATTTETTTGTDTQRAVTPAGLKAGLDARIGGGLVFLGAGPTPPDPSGLPDNHVWFLTGE